MAKCRGCNDGLVWDSGHLVLCPMCKGTGEAPDPLPPANPKFKPPPPPKPKKKK